MAEGADGEDADSISTMRWLVGFSVVIAALGIVTMVVALLTRMSAEPIPGGQTATGRISKVDSVCDIDGCRYTATIVFRAGGRSYTTRTSLDNQDPKPVTGSTVQVSYDPADPALVHDLSLGRSDWAAWDIVGAAFVLIGVPGAWLSARSVRRQR